MRVDERQSDYLPYIDGLRAVAVLAVVAYHLNAAWLPGGFTGVDIFFVISGFVVSASVARFPRAGFFESLLRFYARRLRRIAPALIVCLLATVVASALFIPEAWLSETSRNTGRMAFFGLSNFVLAATGNDYFSPKVEFNPYTHTWSLGVEEQFYVVFPLLFLAWSYGARKRWISLGLFAVGALVSLWYARLLAGAGDRAVEAFYLSTSRFWQLGAGVLLYQALSLAGVSARTGEGGARVGAWLRSAGLALAVLLIAAGFVYARPGHSPWPDGVWPVLGTLLVLGLLYAGGAGGWVGRVLSTAPAVGIGRISYSLYLWHWPVFVLFRWTLGLESAGTRALALGLTFALATASYLWVERPLRHAAPLVRMRNWGFVTAAVLVVFASSAIYRHIARHAQDYSLSVVSRNAGDWYPYGPEADPAYPGCKLVSRTEQIEGGAAWVYERSGCASAPVDARRVFVAGDSHAGAYSELLQRSVLASGRTVRLYFAGGCGVAGLVDRREFDNPQCRGYVDAVLADVTRQARSGDVLFLPALRLPRLSEQWMLFDEQAAVSAMFSADADASRRQGVAGAIERLRPLAQRGVRIVFEAPKPLLRAPPYRCSDWFNRDNPICARGLTVERDFLQRYRAPAVTALQQIAAQVPGASVWDPFPLLCPGQTCAALRDGRPLYFDGDHLSGYGNRVLLPGFAAHLDGLKTGASAPAVAAPAQ
ncbi:acyltransferase family protein [Lysobacter sp. Root983]|uniref:acyltransferase family protein n=1 Tax=Lysobacter sp. Root983 TaxID=1736613 RepID=UPI00070DB4B0|nr:acyltransferase family protein [Lysobacter sp. Root983]KRD79617.1 acetylase [Lysobacter sp. Root983]